MKYKAGDRVKIKSLDWYNENKASDDEIRCYPLWFGKEHSKWCGKVMTISHVRADHYTMVEDLVEYWTDEMIERLVEEETLIERVDDNGFPFNEWLSHKGAFHIPDGYELKDENGNVINAKKIVLEKKKKEYPKTYAECCRVLGVSEFEYNHTGTKMWYRHKLMATLDNLMLCRDAYWELYGNEMGLGKPWEPDWKNSEEKRYCIVNIEGDINLPEKVLTKWILKVTNKILVFPTEEMRDAFYDNFKELIEQCKELL